MHLTIGNLKPAKAYLFTSGFFSAKMECVCGHCGFQYTRKGSDIVKLTDEGVHKATVTNCPTCNQWSRIPLLIQ